MLINKKKYGLLVVMGTALVLRFWGIDFGLPIVFCRPDESAIITIALKFGSLDFNPHYFNYPSFYMYVLFLLYGVQFVGGWMIGYYNNVNDLICSYVSAPTIFYLIPRSLNALLGGMTVFITYRIGRMMFDSRVGMVSAWCLAICHLHVRDSHFGVTDIPMVFWTTLAFYFILKEFHEPKLRVGVLAAIFSAFSITTKYIGVFLIPVYFISKVILYFEKKSSIKNCVYQMLVYLAVLLVGVFVTSPYLFLDHQQAFRDLSFEIKHLKNGHGIKLEWGWIYHLKYTLNYGMGWPLLLASGIGIVNMAFLKCEKMVLLCAFPLLYYFYAGNGYTVFVRYMLPMTPFLCLFSGYCLSVVGDQLNKLTIMKNTRTIILSLLIFAVSVPSLCASVATNNLFMLPDSRLIASQWVKSNIKDRSSIYVLSDFGFPYLDSGLVLNLNPEIDWVKFNFKNKKMISAWAEYLKKTLKTNPQYKFLSFDKKNHKFTYLNYHYELLPDVIIVFEYPGRSESEFAFNGIEKSYEIAKKVVAFDGAVADNWYDQLDLFWIPFHGFRGVERPGPNINIYKLIDGKTVNSRHD